MEKNKDMKPGAEVCAEENRNRKDTKGRSEEDMREKDTLSSEADGEEEQLALSDRDIKIIVSCFMLVVFVSAMIYEMVKPYSLAAPVILFASFLIFVLVTLTDRD